MPRPGPKSPRLSLEYRLPVVRQPADALRLHGLVEPCPYHAAVVGLIRDKAPIAGDRLAVLVKRFERAEDAGGGIHIVGKIHRHGQLGALDPLRRERLAAEGEGNVLRQHFTFNGDGRALQRDLPVSRQHGGGDLLSAPVQLQIGERFPVNGHVPPKVSPVGIRGIRVKVAGLSEVTVGLRVDDRVRPRVQEIPVRLPGRGPFVRAQRLFHHQLESAVLPPGVADGRAAGQLHVRVPRLPVIPHRSVAETLLALGQLGVLPGIFHHFRHVEVDLLVVEPPFLLPVGEGHHQAVGAVAGLPVGVYDALQLVLRHAGLPLQKV